MKKYILMTVLMTLVLTSKSQNIGIRMSYTISNWEGLIYTSDLEVNTLSNFSIGVYGHAPLSPIIVFEPGIFITPKGTRMDKGPFSEPVKNKSLYLDVPIMVKMYLGGSGFHVNAGPQVSYILSNKLISDSGSEDDTLDQFNRWDFAVSFGLAYDTKFGMNIGASFDLGLSNMLINEYYDWTEAKNRVIRISLGYTFM